MSQKTILTILILVLVGLVTFLGGYLLAGRNNLDRAANISQLNRFSENKSGEERDFAKGADVKDQRNIGIGTLNRLSTVKAVSPTISEDGRNVAYFEKGTGKILSVDFLGQETKVLSGRIVENLFSAIWSRNGFETIFNNTYLNTKTGESSRINPNISGITWSDDGKKIAYMFSDESAGESSISIANPDGTLFKNIFKTRSEKLVIDWPSSKLISFHNPSGQDKSLFALDIESGELQKVLSSLDNLKILWSPDGLKLLYSFRDADGTEQDKILDTKNKVEFDLGIMTSADKCVWTLNSLFIYCGAKKETGAPEHLYQFDMAKKEFGVSFESNIAEPIAVEKPILSPTENQLFFVNKTDGYLYTIKLP